jgi:hypothetical protein
MGKLKDEATATATEDIQQHKLTDGEMNYLRLLNIALQYHTMGQKIMSGFCTTSALPASVTKTVLTCSLN